MVVNVFLFFFSCYCDDQFLIITSEAVDMRLAQGNNEQQLGDSNRKPPGPKSYALPLGQSAPRWSCKSHDDYHLGPRRNDKTSWARQTALTNIMYM